MKRNWMIILGLVVVVLAMAGPAQATSTCSASSTTGTCSINLTVTNGFGPNGQVYGTVTLTLNGNGTITVDVAAPSGFGFHNNPFGLNLASDITNVAVVGTPTYTFAGSDPGAPTIGAQGQMDGFGSFSYGVTGGGSGSSSDYTDINFTLSAKDNGVAGFDALSDVINGNTAGANNFFAVQVADLNVANCTGWAGTTGSVNGGGGTSQCVPGTQTPEPGSLGLFGTGLLALGTIIRRKYFA